MGTRIAFESFNWNETRDVLSPPVERRGQGVCYGGSGPRAEESSPYMTGRGVKACHVLGFCKQDAAGGQTGEKKRAAKGSVSGIYKNSPADQKGLASHLGKGHSPTVLHLFGTRKVPCSNKSPVKSSWVKGDGKTVL